MASHDVTGLVAQNSDELGFVVGRQQEARIDIELRSRRSERIDGLGVVDDVNFHRQLWRLASRNGKNALGELADVARHPRIAHESHLGGELSLDLLAELGFLLREGSERSLPPFRIRAERSYRHRTRLLQRRGWLIGRSEGADSDEVTSSSVCPRPMPEHAAYQNRFSSDGYAVNPVNGPGR